MNERTFYDTRRQISDKGNFLGLINIVPWVSVPVLCLGVTGWGRSGRPSSCTLVSGSAAARFSSPTENERLGLRGGRRLTEWLWRRTPLFRPSSPSERLWAVCTCTLRRGRCQGKSPWNQLLLREENRTGVNSAGDKRWAEVQMLLNVMQSYNRIIKCGITLMLCFRFSAVTTTLSSIKF